MRIYSSVSWRMSSNTNDKRMAEQQVTFFQLTDKFFIKIVTP